MEEMSVIIDSSPRLKEKDMTTVLFMLLLQSILEKIFGKKLRISNDSLPKISSPFRVISDKMSISRQKMQYKVYLERRVWK